MPSNRNRKPAKSLSKNTPRNLGREVQATRNLGQNVQAIRGFRTGSKSARNPSASAAESAQSTPPPKPADSDPVEVAADAPHGFWKNRRAHLLPALLLAAVLCLDILTKMLVVSELAAPRTGWPGHHVPSRIVQLIPDCLALQYAENTGAAFSMFRRHPGILSIVNAIIASAICVWYLLTPLGHKITRFSLALILGGALGNLTDRVMRGYVVDFIDAYWRQWHWPTFNVADSSIFIGVGLLIFFAHREQAPKK